MATLLLISQFSTTNFLIGLAAGAVVGAGVILGRAMMTRNSATATAERIVTEAEQKATNIVKSAEVDAKAEYLAKQETFSKESAETRSELKELERRLAKREDGVDRKLGRSPRNAERGDSGFA